MNVRGKYVMYVEIIYDICLHVTISYMSTKINIKTKKMKEGRRKEEKKINK